MNANPVVLPTLQHLPGIKAFFTTRNGGISQGAFSSLNLSFNVGDFAENVAENWKQTFIAQGLSPQALAIPYLCHGSKLQEIIGKPTGKPAFGAESAPEETDAIFTQETEWVLAVTMGDCLAVLIADTESKCIAAVHAGWRGTRDNILGKTLDHLFTTQRCHPKSTWISLSPCLSTPALEISLTIAKTLPSEFVLQYDQHFHFDLRGCNQTQAIAAGVEPRHIEVHPGCTRFEPEQFFSYRRDGAASGRMAACIAFACPKSE